MKERFAHSPLVELVAELRWKDAAGPDAFPGMIPGFPAGMAFPGVTDAFDKQLPELARRMTSIGYGASERLIPAHFPAPREVPVVRYKYSRDVSEDDKDNHLPATLFQMGHGIFTANAVQPYKSWDEFKSVVADGVGVLLSTQHNVQSYSLVLRYIDSFDKYFTDDLTQLEFQRQVFGFRFDVPDCLKKHAGGNEIQFPTIQVSVPLEFGKLQMQMAEGEVQGKRTFVVENVVTVEGETPAELGAIMENFSKARDVIHEVFVSLTLPIKDKMKPVELN